jgi:hypothetical protein
MAERVGHRASSPVSDPNGIEGTKCAVAHAHRPCQSVYVTPRFLWRITNNQDHLKQRTDRLEPTFPKLPPQTCHAPTRSGARCSRLAIQDHIFCRQHAKGGRAKFVVSGFFQAGAGLLWTMGTQPRSVFHYTRAEALQSIVRGSELWLSRQDKLNDTAERTYGRDLLIQAVRRFCSGELAERAAHQIQVIHRALSAVFVFSTALMGDELSLWNYYGQGQGVALELPTGALSSMLNRAQLAVSTGQDAWRPLFFHIFFQSQMGPVIYDPDLQRAYADRVVANQVSFMSREGADGTDAFGRQLALEQAMRTMMLFTKHPKFYSELEYRVCLVPTSNTPDLLQWGAPAPAETVADLHRVIIPFDWKAIELFRSIRCHPQFADWDDHVATLRQQLGCEGHYDGRVSFEVSSIPLTRPAHR